MPAIYQGRYLTGSRKVAYDKNWRVDSVFAIIAGIVFLINVMWLRVVSPSSVVYGTFVVMTVQYLWRFRNHETAHQLRQQEYELGKTQADDILKEVGITKDGKKR